MTEQIGPHDTDSFHNVPPDYATHGHPTEFPLWDGLIAEVDRRMNAEQLEKRLLEMGFDGQTDETHDPIGEENPFDAVLSGLGLGVESLDDLEESSGALRDRIETINQWGPTVPDKLKVWIFFKAHGIPSLTGYLAQVAYLGKFSTPEELIAEVVVGGKKNLFDRAANGWELVNHINQRWVEDWEKARQEKVDGTLRNRLLARLILVLEKLKLHPEPMYPKAED